MNFKLSFFILLISVSLFAQTKYYIYFKDKGDFPTSKMSKTSAAYLTAERELTSASIERRKQVMGEDYITYEDLPINAVYTNKLETSGIKIENKLKWFNAVTSYLTNEQVNTVKAFSFVSKVEAIRIAKKISPIESKIVNATKTASSVQSTTGLNYGGSLNQNALSEVPAVHDLGITGKGVLIGILDTGFRWKSHPALKNLNIIAERDFVQQDAITENQSGDRSDQDSHGTNCLGLMAGFDPGNLIGPAYEATILLAKTEYVPTETRAEEDNYAAALEWMEAQGVQITTSSLGYNEFDGGIGDYPWASFNGQTTITAKAINLAFDRGVTTLTAAGNERGNSWGKLVTPGDALNVITVGAVDFSNNVASFSSPGPTSDGRIKPEVVAMGVSDYVSNSAGKYSYGNGTSYATPIAAGIAGLLKSAWPHLTNQQIRKIFLECGDNPTTPNNDRGWGLISAKRVVSYPNLKQESTSFKLNKIFISSDAINTATIKLNYKIGNGSFQSAAMNYDGVLKYDYSLPNTTNGTLIEFYFTYNTSSGASVREPASSNYKFSYGSFNISNLTSVELGETLPTEFDLSQNYPNPFNPSTTIQYSVSQPGIVQLKVYDILGNEVATLVNQFKQIGIYNSQFSIRNYQLSSGVYFYRLQVGDFSVTKKMVLIK